MKTAFIVCTRTDSERVPNKPFRKINGKTIIEHLICRLEKTGLPIYLAVPNEQIGSYLHLASYTNVVIHGSVHYGDPLSRMNECSIKHGIDNIIRVTHDKIFISEKDIFEAIDYFHRKGLDYLYGSNFIEGTGFEIISSAALSSASAKYKNIEHISYAIRTITDNSFDFDPKQPSGKYRFLIDFPEDLKFFDALLSQVGNEATLLDAINYLKSVPQIKNINYQPKLSVYTCVYNGAQYLEECLSSVASQDDFKLFEYIIIDDHSTDKSTEIIAKFALKYKNVSWIRNDKNIGLASSSNVALKNARGKYIIRLDADDYFVHNYALKDIICEIENTKKEVVYPGNYFGSLKKTQSPKEHHHVGGAIFDKRAINHIKFTDGLRGYEGLDVFMRAKDQLKIGYLNRPMFFYRQHGKSMSKNNLEERAKLKEQILSNNI